MLALAEAEGRHAAHWEELLGPEAARRARPSLRARLLMVLARIFGSVFVLALVQSAEERSSFTSDDDATDAMAADERIHGEVVRALATRSRARMSGTFRAAVFGANDGLVSNLALVLGIGATGVSANVILVTGLAGLLAGALSMAAGEYVSVRSQRELLEASTPDPEANRVLPNLDINANELALVYRARGMSAPEAAAKAWRTIERHAQQAENLKNGTAMSGDTLQSDTVPDDDEAVPQTYEEVGNGWSAALSSFLFFASGALIPVLPYLFGMTGWAAVALSGGLVGLALMFTGGVVGVLSGAAPLPRAMRQLAIGFGAAAITYVLGLAFGVTMG